MFQSVQQLSEMVLSRRDLNEKMYHEVRGSNDPGFPEGFVYTIFQVEEILIIPKEPFSTTQSLGMT